MDNLATSISNDRLRITSLTQKNGGINNQWCRKYAIISMFTLLCVFFTSNVFSQDNCNLTPASSFNLTIWDDVDGSQDCISFRQGTMTNYGNISDIYQFKNNCNETVYFMVCVTLKNGRKTSFSMHIGPNSCSRYAIPDASVKTMQLVQYSYGGEYGRDKKVVWKDCDY